MTNKERYQRAFSTLHASDDFVLEEKKMKETKVIRFPKLLAACAVLILVLGLATAAYAADVGGIRRTVQLWIHGDQTDAVLVIDNGSYDLYYTDQDGQAREQHGGGKAFDIFGNEIPLTEQDIMEHIVLDNALDIQYRDDGTVWACFYAQSVEITDKFDDDGVCYVQLAGNGQTVYVTVKYQNGFAYGTHGYSSPNSFN